ncbi:hypothetical protein HRbin21_01235 [bacterium HR21]|nr:hypothetical protein HRbin21_01235 [bacterium HR21]
MWSGAVALGTLGLAAWGWIGWGLWESWRSQWMQLRLQVFCRPESIPRARQLLEQSGLVATLTVISPEEGWRLVRHLLRVEETALGSDTVLPAVLSVSLRERIPPQQLGRLYEQLWKVEGVHALDFPWHRFSELLWQRALMQVGWYGCGGGVGLLWLSFAWLVGRELRRRLAEYGVLVLLGIPPRRLRLPALLGTFSATGIGIGVAAGIAVTLWYGLQRNFAGYLPNLPDMVQAGQKWLGSTAVGWVLLLAVLVSVALGGRFTR